MGWFSNIYQRFSKANDKDHEPTTFTFRQGKTVPADDAFLAWTSGDLNQMLEAVSTKTNPIDRHYLLQSIVQETYKLRKDEKYRKLCIDYSEKHLAEFPTIAPALKEDVGGFLPRVTTFQNYATVLTENKDYDRAVSICEEALKYGLHDSTQSGFEGRIARIKTMAKNDNA